MDNVSMSEKPICVFTVSGEDIVISDGYIGGNSDCREKIQLVCLSAEGDYNEISPEDVIDVIKTSMMCGKRKFINYYKKNLQPLSAQKRFGCSIKDDQKITAHQRTTYKDSNNSLMLRLDADNHVDHVSRSKEVYFSVSKLKLFSNWYMRKKSEDEILLFKYDRKSFMKVLYSFNPIVKLERTLVNYDTNQSNYKSTFLKMIGLERSPEFQESDSKTELSDMILSDVEKDDKNSKSKWTCDRKSVFDEDKAHSNNNVHKSKARSSESDHKSKTSSRESDHKLKANFSKSVHKPNAHSSESNRKSVRLPSRCNYTVEEDKFILKWVLKNNNSKMVNGNTIWKDLEINKNLPFERTWQSLRNRYLKNILYNLRDYGLSSSDEMKLKTGAERGTIKKIRVHASPIREKNTNKLTVIRNKISPISQEPSAKKICKEKSDKNHDNYKDSDVLSDDTSSISYKDFKTDVKKSRKRHLFTNKTFLQSSPKDVRSST